MKLALALLGLLASNAASFCAGYALAALAAPEPMTTEQVRARVLTSRTFGPLDDDLLLPDNAGA